MQPTACKSVSRVPCLDNAALVNTVWRKPNWSEVGIRNVGDVIIKIMGRLMGLRMAELYNS
jgi:hypothetical protein